MRPSTSWQMPPSALLLAIAITIFGASTALAQTDLPAISTSTGTAASTAESSTATATAASSQSSTAESSVTNASSTSGTSRASSSGSASASAASSISSSATSTTALPGVSSSTTLPGVTITDLPTLDGGYNYPAPTVPPTANAPYMQKSNLPEDSVFIAVGSALAFFGLVIMAWRLLVAWSINRSVQRAAAAGYRQVSDPKAYRKKAGLEPYSDAPMGTNMSLEKLGPGSRTATTISKGPTPNASLFFSPTAGAGMRAPSNQQASTYLPAGYYAAGSAAPGGGSGMTTIGGTGDRPSKSNNQSSRIVIGSGNHAGPYDSPRVRPPVSGLSTPDSRSVLNIPPPSGERTPSTYLEDMMSNTAPPLPPSADAAFKTSRGSRRNSGSSTDNRRVNRGPESRRDSRGVDGRRDSRGAEGRRTSREVEGRRTSRDAEGRRTSRDPEGRRSSRGEESRRVSHGPETRRTSRGPDSRRNSQGQQDNRGEHRRRHRDY